MTQDQKKSGKKRRLAALMFTDMVGYSALTQKNESLAIELLEEHRKILRTIFFKHEGIEVETVGDAFFVEFKSALESVNCAIEIQRKLYERNTKQDPERNIQLRIGLHVGDVIQVDHHVHGDGVNIAARLEPLSRPGGICLSEDVVRQIQNKIDFPVAKIGAERLKNIQSPVNIYHLLLPWDNNNPIKEKSILRKFVSEHYVNIAIAILLIAVAVLLLNYLFTDKKGGLSATRIAVIPLTNISEDSRDVYFADGMTEELISQLTKISDLSVIARTSVMKYKNTGLDIEEIGKELDVGTILGGSVRKADQKARITVRLIDVKTQENLWTAEYDRELKDIFAIQSDIALKIANELRIQLIPEERQQIEKLGTENVEAYGLYLLGKHSLNKKNEESIIKGLDCFTKATDLDSKYALAYVGIAECYTLMGGGGYSSLSQEMITDRAKSAVKKALEMDDMLAEAYNALAYINFRLEWNWDDAEKNFKMAMKLKPGYASVYEKYSFFLALMGRFDEAIPLMEHAHKLDPLSASVITGLGRILHFDRQHDKAIEQFYKVLKSEPDYVEAIFALGLSYDQKKMYNQAINYLKRAIDLSNGRPIIVASLGEVYARMGKQDEAIKILEELKNRHKRERISEFYAAMVDAALGNIEKNMNIFYKAYDEKFGLLVYIKVEPLLDPFRDTPWFHQLMEKMKLKAITAG